MYLFYNFNLENLKRIEMTEKDRSKMEMFAFLHPQLFKDIVSNANANKDEDKTTAEIAEESYESATFYTNYYTKRFEKDLDNLVESVSVAKSKTFKPSNL